MQGTDPDAQTAELIAHLKDFAGKERINRNRATKVVVFLGGESLGDFVRQGVVAAALTRRLRGAYVVAVYRNDPAYRQFVVACNPYVHSEVTADAGTDVTIPVDWFDVGTFAPVKASEPLWTERGLDNPDLVLLPPMLSADAARLSAIAEAPPLFRLPPERRRSLAEDLEKRGLERGRWFACVHAGEAGPGDETPAERRAAAAPQPYGCLIEHITRNQGGHVAWLGGPGAPPFPDGQGVIDLTGEGDSFAERVAALSVARYAIGQKPGPAALASAFLVPSAATDVIGFGNMVWNRDDMVLAKRLVLPDGRVLGTREAFEQGFLSGHRPGGPARSADNAPEDLIAVADHMFEKTADCPAWRPPPREPAAAEARGLTLPLETLAEPLVSFWD